jgi:hypothetical protein
VFLQALEEGWGTIICGSLMLANTFQVALDVLVFIRFCSVTSMRQPHLDKITGYRSIPQTHNFLIPKGTFFMPNPPK